MALWRLLAFDHTAFSDDDKGCPEQRVGEVWTVLVVDQRLKIIVSGVFVATGLLVPEALVWVILIPVTVGVFALMFGWAVTWLEVRRGQRGFRQGAPAIWFVNET